LICMVPTTIPFRLRMETFCMRIRKEQGQVEEAMLTNLASLTDLKAPHSDPGAGALARRKQDDYRFKDDHIGAGNVQAGFQAKQPQRFAQD